MKSLVFLLFARICFSYTPLTGNGTFTCTVINDLFGTNYNCENVTVFNVYTGEATDTDTLIDINNEFLIGLEIKNYDVYGLIMVLQAANYLAADIIQKTYRNLGTYIYTDIPIFNLFNSIDEFPIIDFQERDWNGSIGLRYPKEDTDTFLQFVFSNGTTTGYKISDFFSNTKTFNQSFQDIFKTINDTNIVPNDVTLPITRIFERIFPDYIQNSNNLKLEDNNIIKLINFRCNVSDINLQDASTCVGTDIQQDQTFVYLREFCTVGTDIYTCLGNGNWTITGTNTTGQVCPDPTLTVRNFTPFICNTTSYISKTFCKPSCFNPIGGNLTCVDQSWLGEYFDCGRNLGVKNAANYLALVLLLVVLF